MVGVVARGDDTDIPKGRIRRTAQVGSVVGSQGARYAGTVARNLARDRDQAALALEQRHMEVAEQMVETLGRMKGAAMKIGQLASFIDTEFLPPEYRDLYQDKLATLRSTAPPMPWNKVRRVLDEDWDEPHGRDDGTRYGARGVSGAGQRGRAELGGAARGSRGAGAERAPYEAIAVAAAAPRGRGGARTRP